MGKNRGFSREGLFGTIHHYDSKGHKIGESRPKLFGGYTNYDNKGHVIGHSEEKFLGGGFNHYDKSGKKIGSSDERLLGGYKNRDASGHVTGTTERSALDIKTPDEIAATGSLYGSTMYPRAAVQGAILAAAAEEIQRQEQAQSGSFTPVGEVEEEFEDTFIKGDFISAEDMKLLSEAGYEEWELDSMDKEEFLEALENAGVYPDVYLFDFD